MVHPYYGILSSSKQNKLLIHAIIWVDLKGIMVEGKNHKGSHTVWRKEIAKTGSFVVKQFSLDSDSYTNLTQYKIHRAIYTHTNECL